MSFKIAERDTKVLNPALNCEQGRLGTFQSLPADISTQLYPSELADLGFYLRNVKNIWSLICVWCETIFSLQNDIKEFRVHGQSCNSRAAGEAASATFHNIPFKSAANDTLLERFERLLPAVRGDASWVVDVDVSRQSLRNDGSGSRSDGSGSRSDGVESVDAVNAAAGSLQKDWASQGSVQAPQRVKVERSTPLYNVEPREIKARLDTPRVQHVRRYGYPLELIARVLEERLVTVGDDFPNLVEFVVAIRAAQARPSSSYQTALATKPLSGPAAAAASSTNQLLATSASRITDDSGRSLSSIRAEANLDSSAVGLNTTDADTYRGNSEDALSIIEENRQLKEARLCKMCMTADISIVFLPCGHACSCVECANSLRDCPICRELIKGTVKIFV